MFGVFYISDQIWLFIFGHFLQFSLICDFNFWQLAPPPPLNICFKRCFKSLFSQFQRKKTVSKELKTWYFSYSAFWLTGQWGGAFAPPGYATGWRPKKRSRNVHKFWFSSQKPSDCPRILRWRSKKKKGLRPKIYAMFHEIRCEATQKLLKNSSCTGILEQ